MTLQDFINDLQAAGGVVAQGIATLETLDPAVVPEAEIAKLVFNISSDLVSKALTAWSNASGQPITVETVLALLPNPDPLTPPAA